MKVLQFVLFKSKVYVTTRYKNITVIRDRKIQHFSLLNDMCIDRG